MKASADDDTLDPEAARVLARVRRLMLIAGLTTMLALAAVLGVIGYRVFTIQGSAPSGSDKVADAIATLPAGARVIATAVSGDRLVVTIALSDGIEMRSFDLHSLQPTGRLRFKSSP